MGENATVTGIRIAHRSYTAMAKLVVEAVRDDTGNDAKDKFFDMLGRLDEDPERVDPWLTTYPDEFHIEYFPDVALLHPDHALIVSKADVEADAYGAGEMFAHECASHIDGVILTVSCCYIYLTITDFARGCGDDCELAMNCDTYVKRTLDMIRVAGLLKQHGRALEGMEVQITSCQECY